MTSTKTDIDMDDDNHSTSSQLPDDLKRFALELEFVQALASPAYLHHLATQGYLQDPAFLNFLKYLQYWTRSEYAKYITYPHCLYFLDLLTDPKCETFRKELPNLPFRDFVHQQQFYNWQYRSRILYGKGSSSLGGEKENEQDNVQSGKEKDVEGEET